MLCIPTETACIFLVLYAHCTCSGHFQFSAGTLKLYFGASSPCLFTQMFAHSLRWRRNECCVNLSIWAHVIMTACLHQRGINFNLRQFQRSWPTSTSLNCAYRPMRIVSMDFHTWIIIARRNMNYNMGLIFKFLSLRTWNLSLLKTKNLFQSFPKIDQNLSKEKPLSVRLRPPLLLRARWTPTWRGAGDDRGLSLWKIIDDDDDCLYYYKK